MTEQSKGDSVLIIAVMHLRRHPDSWKLQLRLAEQ